MRCVLAAVALVACHRDAPPPAPASTRIAVGVNRRVELFSVIERLADLPKYTRAATPYAQAADAWFAPYKDSRAVADFRALRASHGISYDAALTLAVQLDAQLQPLRSLAPLPKASTRAGKASMSRTCSPRFAGSRRRAARRLPRRPGGVRQGRRRAAVSVRLGARARAVVRWRVRRAHRRELPNRTGPPHRHDELRPAREPARHPRGHLPRSADRDGLPTYGPISEALLAHELAHSYVNPIVHAHLADVSAVSATLDAAQPAMARQHYLSRENVADESLVRAATVIYLRERVSAAAADANLAEQAQLGFAWTPALVAALDQARAAAPDHEWRDTDLLAAFTTVVLR